MITGLAVVAEARTWADTPFRHQARLKGVGVDCVGLVIGVAHNLGLTDFDTFDYSEQPDETRMGALLREHMLEIPRADLAAGDIVWLRPVDGGAAQHVAIITETAPRLMMIHALRRPVNRSNTRVNRVVEHVLDERWESRIVGCFRYRGLV